MIDLKDPTTWVAGRETDAAIAEILGWKNCRYINFHNDWYGIHPGSIYGDNPPPNHYSSLVPYYTTTDPLALARAILAWKAAQDETDSGTI